MKKLLLVGATALLMASCSQKLTLNDYAIVVPEQATPVETRAASELQRYFAEMAGVELPIVSDTVTPAEKEILIGATNRAELPELGELGDDGYVIRVVDGKLAIQGGPRKGTLYGVYGLVEDYFGCRIYTPAVKITPQHEKLQVKANLYDKQIPDFIERYGSALPMDTVTNDWLRRTSTPEGAREGWGLFVHTFDILLPHEWFDTHPEYFALVKGRRGKTQPCLSNPAVLEIVCENLEKEIAKNPEARYWSVSSNDNFQYCECPECAAVDAEEGGPTGSVIRFVNQVAERFPEKDISTLAYQYTRHAPTQTKPLPNVNIMFCNIECDRRNPLDAGTDSVNIAFCADMEDWSKLTDNIFLWDYGVSFNELQRPFPNWHVLQPNMQYFRDHNVTSMFNLLSGRIGGELCEMRSYLVSKLMWDPDMDYDAVMDDFLKGYYGAAGPHIKQYLKTITKYMQESGVFLNTQRYSVEYMDTWLTVDRMKEYEALLDKAVAAVAGNPELEERAKIVRKTIYFPQLELSRFYPYAPNGALEEVDGRWQAKQEWLNKLNEFTELCKAQGVWRVTEHHSTPDEYREQMLDFVNVRQQGNLAYRKPVSVNVEPNPKRNPRGEGLPLLTDGLCGTQICVAQWLGFYEPEFEVTVDLENIQSVSQVDASFLQVLWESAFLPERVEVLTSADGQNFAPAGVQAHTVTKDPFYGVKHYVFDLAPRDARYVKVKVNALDICPVWHYYSGDDALAFIDEVVVR